MSTLCFANPTLPLAALGTVGIVGGTIGVAHAMTSGRQEITIPSSIIYIVGWLVLIIAAAMTYEDANTDKCAKIGFTWRGFFLSALPLLIVMGVTLGTYFIMSSPERKEYLNYSMGAFAITWLIFAIGLSFRDGGFRLDKFILAVLSGLSILAGMHFMQRREGYTVRIPGISSGSGTTFNPGLPLYILGFVGAALSISYVGACDPCVPKK